MPELIISVRDSAEALLAAHAGAKWIDVKEPSRGSLGAASLIVRDEIAAVLSSQPQLILSAADGELVDWQLPAQTQNWSDRYQYAEVGLTRCATIPNWMSHWQAWREHLSSNTTPVLVYYADGDRHGQPVIDEIKQLIEREQIQWLLIDTFDKNGPGLCELLPESQLRDLVQQFRQHIPQIVLAGKVRLEQFPQLLTYQPSAIAVRSAICQFSQEQSSRTGSICEQQVRACLKFCG